jgi:putative transposase
LANAAVSKGFVHLVAVMDWFSRRVLAWRLSIGMNTDFCVEALQEAMERFGQLKVFNTDQGVQFTSAASLDELEGRRVRVSMDSKGKFLDNIFIERLWHRLKYKEAFIERIARSPRHVAVWARGSRSTIPSARTRR